MKRTFIDAGVLIAAATGKDEIARRAIAILGDPNREFASSEFVRLEVLPKAIYHQKQDEALFYQTFFEAVTHWPASYETVIHNAYQEASSIGLNAVDALHLAAAISVDAVELVTTERPTKPLHRSTALQITSLKD